MGHDSAMLVARHGTTSSRQCDGTTARVSGTQHDGTMTAQLQHDDGTKARRRLDNLDNSTATACNNSRIYGYLKGPFVIDLRGLYRRETKSGKLIAYVTTETSRVTRFI